MIDGKMIVKAAIIQPNPVGRISPPKAASASVNGIEVRNAVKVIPAIRLIQWTLGFQRRATL